ncbi:hypothetical protein BDF20DRAFT_331001 [Mycotypha africana]|uniref:uncharacterized protein n=1 Tax=Mycotypha africana TaxID=64632 RepID=UPI002301D9A0|nr:uncharacterized protein BDF20DRAFT_331001 [Mycotypha africana]KAI8988414.1 hypothetical protein BDF20DRAFT_331001 [Mycotypha africana]
MPLMNRPYAQPFRTIPKPSTSFSSSSSTTLPRKRAIRPDPEEEEDSEEEVRVERSSVASMPTVRGTSQHPPPTLEAASDRANMTPLKRPRFGLSKASPSTHLHHATIPALPHLQGHQHPMSMMIANRQKSTHRSAEIVTTATPLPPLTTSTSTVVDNTHGSSSFATASTLAAEQQSTVTGTSNASSSKTTSSSFKSPLANGTYTQVTLQFPNSKKAFSILKSKKYPKRSKTVPAKFNSVNAYTETFKKLILEHLEILLLNYGLYFYTMYEKFGKHKHGQELERAIRSKGMSLYVLCEIKSTYPSFSSLSSSSLEGEGHRRLRLMIPATSREHSSKYAKDDIWVLSKVSSFESSQTFLARSTFYGPFSDGSLELECISPRDARVAAQILKEEADVYALRTIAASTEFMMLDTLNDNVLLSKLNLLPYIMTDDQIRKSNRKSKKPGGGGGGSIEYPTLHCIRLTVGDGIDVEAKLVDTIREYKLNLDQERVLRQVAHTLIVAPGWNENANRPFVLVHGVYGSGKR